LQKEKDFLLSLVPVVVQAMAIRIRKRLLRSVVNYTNMQLLRQYLLAKKLQS